MNEKIKWLREKLRGLDMQGMIVSNPVNVRYLAGIDAEGVLLITRKENHYITDSRYLEEVHSVVTVDDEIIVSNCADISIYDYENFFSFCENVGFEENYISYATYKNYLQKYKVNNFEETEGLIEKGRAIKDDKEIENLKKACEITDDCFTHLQEYIKILGRREDVPQILKLTNIYVASSLREGLPVNIMEAMYMGLPVIATDNRGHRELIKNEENGYLISLKQKEKDFGEKIIELSNNKKICGKFKEENKKNVKKFSLEEVIKKMTKIYMN